MVQGAPQTAGRFPQVLRMYKAPPPEVSTEQFYETDVARGFARGFSIQTVGPLPIRWAEHVLAEATGAGRCASTCATTTTGRRSVPSPTAPLPDNRVTLADETDRVRHAARPDRLLASATTTRPTSPTQRGS